MINNYSCNCNHFDFSKREYTYWEDRNVTIGEKNIIDFMQKNFALNNKKILHVGIGNSYLHTQLKNNNYIYGITVSNKELNFSKKFHSKNYLTFFCDKHSNKLNSIFNNIKFDYIIDNNLKSYVCCYKSFENMFKNFKNLLNHNGLIITSIEGMNWQKKLVPKLTFNLKRFFYFKLKEVDINHSNNIFSLKEAESISKKFSLTLFNNKEICYFSRNF